MSNTAEATVRDPAIKRIGQIFEVLEWELSRQMQLLERNEGADA